MADQAVDSAGYYDCHAAAFAADTADLDMSALYQRFLHHVPPRGRLLDAGCGVGRDVRAFADLGFQVLGFDASFEMVLLARKRAGKRAEIRHMRFEDVAWSETFDGIWACASLLHVAATELASVCGRLATALRPGAVFYMSFKLGVGERLTYGRMFTDHTAETLRAVLTDLPLDLFDTWITEDIRPGRTDERWLNALARKHRAQRVA